MQKKKYIITYLGLTNLLLYRERYNLIQDEPSHKVQMKNKDILTNFRMEYYYLVVIPKNMYTTMHGSTVHR